MRKPELINMYIILIMSLTYFSSNVHSQISGEGSLDCSGTMDILAVLSACDYKEFKNEENGTGQTVNASCASGYGNSYQDIWYSLTGTGNNVTISIDNPDEDCVLAAFTGCGTGEIACTTIDQGANGNIVIATTLGLEYFIQIQRRSGNPVADLKGDICATDVNPPANDDPCSAQPLTVSSSCSMSFYSNTSATDSGITDPGCGDYSGGDVWFSATVPPSGNLFIDSDEGGQDLDFTDSGIAVYSGTCGSPSLIACDDDNSLNGGGKMSYLELTGLTPGSTIFIRVWEKGNDKEGPFQICVYDPTPPPNDDPCNAIPLNTGSTCSFATYTTYNATNSGVANPGCGNYAGGDVWFSDVVNSTGQIQFDTQEIDFNNSGIAAYSGSCSSLTLIECDDDDGTGTMSNLNLTGLTPGTTIFLRVWESGNDESGSFDLCAVAPTPPNSEPCGATALNVGTSCSFSTHSTLDMTDSGIADPGCGDYQGGDVWFTATVPASGELTIDTDDDLAITNSGLAVYSGTCGALTFIECDDDDSANGLMSMIELTGLTPGATIYIRFGKKETMLKGDSLFVLTTEIHL